MKSTVKDVMTSHVVYAKRDATYKALAARMRELRISGFPVVDDADKVIGVVSATDMLNKEALDNGDSLTGLVSGIFRHHREVEKAEGVTAGELMTHPAVTVSPGDTIEHAARLMYSRRLKRLPVVNSAGHLAGIITRTDLLAVFDRPDAGIRKEITSTILSDYLMDPRRFSVMVKDGIVTLHGEPETTDLGHQIVRTVRHIQGVVAVRDRLTYPEPDMVATPGRYVNH
ncbi:MAG TPA: CBS domain-containing protein [Streptosporangiaceae bacterium]|nr:CBS domain-containing protein [Streptosporangiaceae bacterium]